MPGSLNPEPGTVITLALQRQAAMAANRLSWPVDVGGRDVLIVSAVGGMVPALMGCSRAVAGLQQGCSWDVAGM